MFKYASDHTIPMVSTRNFLRAEGCYVWDEEGHSYIDLSMASGSVLLGYHHKAVSKGIRKQLKKGIDFSTLHSLEVEVAEMIRQFIPGAESIRFARTAQGITGAAIQLAFQYTGKSNILCSNSYDLYAWGNSNTRRERVLRFEYNNLPSLERSLNDSVACVILEPVSFEEPRTGFLRRVRELCRKRGALLIFDEIWSGFRIATGGAQHYFKVTADLACFSNSLANGVPLSVLTGRKEIMELVDENFLLSSESRPDAFALAAAKTTIRKFQTKDIPRYIASSNRLLRDCYNRIAEELKIPYTRCVGLDYRTRIIFDPAAGDPAQMNSLLQTELLRQGVIWDGFHNLSFAHKQQDLIRILSAYSRALSVLKLSFENEELRTNTSRQQELSV